jgi:ParB family chromosome partitioning protein
MSKTAIDQQRSTTFMVSPSLPRVIGLDTPHKKGEHPLWQARAIEPVDEIFAQQIARNGFQSIIDVRKDGPHLDVVAGRRRIKAARRAVEIRKEWELQGDVDMQALPPLLVECKVVRGMDMQLVARMISENANRKDVEPIQMAEDLQNYMNMGATEDMAALAGGKTVAQLRTFLKLLDLAPQVQDAVRIGKISSSAAIHLADLEREEQVKELGKIEAGEAGATLADVSARVRAKKKGSEDVQKAPGKRLVQKLLESEEGCQVLTQANGVDLARWMMGELHPRKIKGLVGAINKVSEKA